MTRSEGLLAMILMTSLGMAAQSPENGQNVTPAAPVHDSAAQPVVAAEAATRVDLKAPAPDAVNQAATVSTSASASFSPLPPDASAPTAVSPLYAELQSQIQEALKKDPSLSKCALMVAASAEGIDLSGNAGSSRERLAAWRLAQSYARGRKVENHIVVSRDGVNAPPAAHPENPAPAAGSTPSTPVSPGVQNNRQ
jgi:hypothetical protein